MFTNEQTNHHTKTRRKHTMGRMRENPRYNVISMRISDEEREHLENIMEKTQKSISDIMREAMDHFAATHEVELQHKAA
jgi:arsenate reductase-like glutaredoxin family protein